MTRPRPLLSSLLLAAAACPAPAQLPNNPGQVQGTAEREQMWRAPTAEEWKKPVLITFQRTWEDAVAVSRETQKPILVCINMDGEIASEHYAGVRYRQPEVAQLYEDYVCVIASVYRHNPRDHDEHGHRIPCPRFGSVTCGEHIAIEPLMFEKFMDGRRIAPRHIMVELDGSETFDVYFAFDTASVFDALHDGIAKRALQPPVVVRGDKPIVERVASRDIVDRKAVEQAYVHGDADTRRKLLASALQHIDRAPDGLLRLAVNGLDADFARMAREALAKAQAPSTVDVIADALDVPMAEAEREALVSALERIGRESPKARRLAVVQRGLATRSRTVDVDGWSQSLTGAEYPAPTDFAEIETRLVRSEQAVNDDSDDPQARLDMAAASLALAIDDAAQDHLSRERGIASRFQRLHLQDARRQALEAESRGASGWRVDAVVALSSCYLDDVEQAYARAEKAAAALPPDAGERLSVQVLALFAEARQQAVIAAVRAREDWPRSWVSDVHAAYAVIARHPLGTDLHAAAHYDFIQWLGGRRRATQILEQGLERFPASAALHDRLRSRVLAEAGVDGLEPAYAAMLAEPDAAPELTWFAGYTAMVAAEFHRRAGAGERAAASYDRAIARFDRAAAALPDTRDSCDHYAALAAAGKARLALEAGDLDRAVADLLTSFERRPRSAASLDGLNVSPADTARTLRARLVEQERDDLRQRIDDGLARLAEIDPALLQLPAYERQAPADPAAEADARRRGRRR